MPPLHRVAPLVLAVAACVICTAAEPPATPTRDQIAKWVKQLGADDFSAREEASQNLYQAGHDAEGPLQDALASDDAEVVMRSRAILDKFKWGLYPDASKSVVDVINRYRAADIAGKQAVVQDLLNGGPSDYRTLLGIVRAEPDAEARTAVLSLVTSQLSRTAPQLLADGNDESLELLLDVVLANDARQGAPHYAAYWLMRGKLDERIAHFKALAAKGIDPGHDWEVVAHLSRANGDLDRRAARPPTRRASRNWPTPSSSKPATGRRWPTGRSTAPPASPTRRSPCGRRTITSPGTPRASTKASPPCAILPAPHRSQISNFSSPKCCYSTTGPTRASRSWPASRGGGRTRSRC